MTKNFDEILEELSFVDKIIFGRLNYNKQVSEYKDYKNFFNELADKVVTFCKKNKKQYHIKEGTVTEPTYCSNSPKQCVCSVGQSNIF